MAYGSVTDQKWSREVRSLLGEAGVRVVQTPLQASAPMRDGERFWYEICSSQTTLE